MEVFSESKQISSTVINFFGVLTKSTVYEKVISHQIKKGCNVTKKKKVFILNSFVRESRSKARHRGGERFCFIRKKLSLKNFATYFNFNILVNLNSFNFTVRGFYTKIICSDSKFTLYWSILNHLKLYSSPYGAKS